MSFTAVIVVLAVIAFVDCSEKEIERKLNILEAKFDKKIEELENKNRALEEEIARHNYNQDTSIQRVLRQASVERVAFSAYMGPHGEQHIGIGQTIKFDKVLVNEGNAYSNLTGIFQAPADGIYLFSYFIGKSYQGQAVVQLTKNGQSVNAAIADVPRTFEDSMGGNVAVVSLARGDLVWVEEYTNADASFNPDHRWTTFSGVLLPV